MTPRGGRISTGTEADARRHWRKSRDFAKAARLELEHEVPVAAYSNAIFAVIHACDALCLHYLGRRSASQDHRDATSLFATIAEIPTPIKSAFQRRVDGLLDVKSRVQYSGDEFGQVDAAEALKHMDRALAAVKDMTAKFGWERP